MVRNIGGRVRAEVINNVAFISHLAEKGLPEGPLFEVAVIHRAQCGAGALADETFRREYAERIGDLGDTAHRACGRRSNGHGHRRCAAAAFRPIGFAADQRFGHVYDVVTGLVETVRPAGGGNIAA